MATVPNNSGGCPRREVGEELGDGGPDAAALVALLAPSLGRLGPRQCFGHKVVKHPFPVSVDVLGKALAKKGDRQGACAAFSVVLEHWGKARPRSGSAEHARKLSRELGCPAR